MAAHSMRILGEFLDMAQSLDYVNLERQVAIIKQFQSALGYAPGMDLGCIDPDVYGKVYNAVESEDPAVMVPVFAEAWLAVRKEWLRLDKPEMAEEWSRRYYADRYPEAGCDAD